MTGGRWPISWILALFVGVIAWAFFVKWQHDAPADAHTSVAMDHAAHAGMHAGMHAGAPATATAPIITTTFDANGRLYAVEAIEDGVTLSVSDDKGVSFGPAVLVTPEPEAIDANGEARPKVAIGPGGEVLVSWTRRGQALFTGDIRFARSVDGGRTFSPPVTINDDGLAIGHRFDTLGVAPDGTVVLTWIDKRDLEAATAAGQAYDGAAIYLATSRDGGASFAPNRKVDDHTCECCRIALAFDADSTPILFWRDVLPGSVRDHMVARVLQQGDTPVPHRVSHENWTIEACPHHGPALAVTSSGRYHFAWFTGAQSTGQAVSYAYSDDGGVTTSTPLRIGTGPLAGHPAFAATSRRLWLAWKQWRDDDGTEVLLMHSDDEGRTWGAPRPVATGATNSDRPFLLTHGDDVYLSWTDTRGLHVIAVQ